MKTFARFVGVVVTASLFGCQKPPPAPAPAPPAWQLLASELPSALMSVGGRSATDIYAVGADKGHGPLVMHFDGNAWKDLHTGQRGDLWWVQALPDGPVLLAGAGAKGLPLHCHPLWRKHTARVGQRTLYNSSVDLGRRLSSLL